MKLSIKLFATIRLDTGLKLVDVNIDKPVNIVEMLKIVSDPYFPSFYDYQSIFRLS